jgi:hypothetical protein
VGKIVHGSLPALSSSTGLLQALSKGFKVEGKRLNGIRPR